MQYVGRDLQSTTETKELLFLERDEHRLGRGLVPTSLMGYTFYTRLVPRTLIVVARKSFVGKDTSSYWVAFLKLELMFCIERLPESRV